MGASLVPKKTRKASPRFRTKPGKYGPLFLYRIKYGDGRPGSRDYLPIGTYQQWAYNLEHAEENFLASDEGFTIESIARVLEGVSQHRAREHFPRR
jgi:hypothetical protein